jgi:hypothetical protein
VQASLMTAAWRESDNFSQTYVFPALLRIASSLRCLSNRSRSSWRACFMLPVTFHNVSTCPAPVRRGGFARGLSRVRGRSFGSFARNLLHRVVSAAVPIDGAHWADRGNIPSQVGVAKADRATPQRTAKVASERLPVRWANWR